LLGFGFVGVGAGSRLDHYGHLNEVAADLLHEVLLGQNAHKDPERACWSLLRGAEKYEQKYGEKRFVQSYATLFD
jgi:hypothetical protein